MKRCHYRLYAVTDRPSSYAGGLLAGVEAAVAGGVTLVQYRPTTGCKREWYHEALALHEMLMVRKVPLIINDHLDLALAIDAEGLHVGQDDLPVTVARRVLGPGRVLGLSITHPSQLAAVPAGVVDYLGAGPVYPTATKADAAPALGLEGLRAITAGTDLPVVAIGGIQYSNTPELLAAGAAGIAVVSALSRAAEPAAEARRLLSLFPPTP